jgi:hypothetical protein
MTAVSADELKQLHARADEVRAVLTARGLADADIDVAVWNHGPGGAYLHLSPGRGRPALSWWSEKPGHILMALPPISNVWHETDLPGDATAVELVDAFLALVEEMGRLGS